MSAAQDLAGLIADVRKAQVARSTYRDKAATQQLRDAAVIEYGRAQDAICERLDRMMETGALATISKRLEKRRWW
jgi:hypothetical protein